MPPILLNCFWYLLAVYFHKCRTSLWLILIYYAFVICSHIFVSVQVRQTFVGRCPYLLIHVQIYCFPCFPWQMCILGIDSLVRSLKEALQLTNLEVPKQGLLLLTEILERWWSSMKAFVISCCPTAKISTALAGYYNFLHPWQIMSQG